MKTDKSKLTHWFAIKVKFRCPFCQTENEEVMYSGAQTADTKKIASAVTTQNVKCKNCGRVPTDGTQIGINVLPVTLEQAKAGGFKPDPALGL
jgi:transcription elongation factor Elf1